MKIHSKEGVANKIMREIAAIKSKGDMVDCIVLTPSEYMEVASIFDKGQWSNSYEVRDTLIEHRTFNHGGSHTRVIESARITGIPVFVVNFPHTGDPT